MHTTTSPVTVLTIGTVSGQDLRVTTASDPAELARQLVTLAPGARPVQLVTVDGQEVWLRPEHIESVAFSALLPAPAPEV